MFGTWGTVVLSAAASAFLVAAGLIAARTSFRTNRRRLGRLSVFFFLFALVQGVLVVETVLLISGPPMRTLEEAGLLQASFWSRHAVLLVALAFAVAAFGWRRPGRGQGQGHVQASVQEKAGFVVPLFAFAHPLLLVVEGVGWFYLVIRAADHHARRHDAGSLWVVLGFALLLVAHLSPFVVEPSGPSVFGVPGGGSALFVFAGALVLMLSMSKEGQAAKKELDDSG